MHRLGFYLCWYSCRMNHKDILESSRIGKWKYSSTHVLKTHLLWRSYMFLIRSYTFREASSLWFCVGSCRPSCSEVIRSYTFLYVPCNPLSKSLQSCPEAIRSYTFRATLSQFCEIIIRSYTFLLHSYTFRLLFQRICHRVIRACTFRANLS